MNAMLLRLTLIALCCSFLQPAFAADKTGSDGFLIAMPGYDFQFPRDHGSHEGYRTEWWYYTGHLRAEDGHRYGFEVTFFRVGVDPRPADAAWDLRHLSLAHFAITDIDGKQFRYYEKLNRSSKFTAQASSGHLDVFNEGWRATTAPDGAWHLVAFEGADALDLTLRMRKPPAIHGANGVSVKAAGEGHASHYYSMTRIEVTGRVNGRACSGQAWMDHEFGSSALRENQQGWDWFSIQLDNETELMLYVIRRTDGTPDVTSSGSFIMSDGSVLPIRCGEMQIASHRRWRSKRSSATYPLDWTVTIPKLGIRLDLKALVDDQELVTRSSTNVTYWEGAVLVAGSFRNVAVSGEGYVEMTGYDRAFRTP